MIKYVIGKRYICVMARKLTETYKSSFTRTLRYSTDPTTDLQLN